MNGPPDAPERIDKIISNNGYGSRSDARRLIRSGSVTCDGVIVRAPEKKFYAASTAIEVCGGKLSYNKHVYIMMDKPAGVLSASYDPKRVTAADLLPEYYKTRNPFPAGRLDIDATGLLLLTDDGGLAHRLLSPKNHIEKEYVVTLDRPPGGGVAEGFGEGVELGGGLRLRPAKLLPVSESAAHGALKSSAAAYKSVAAYCETAAAACETALNFYETAAVICDTTAVSEGRAARVILTEGKFHQIKRMFQVYGIRVVTLRRVRIGALYLDPRLGPGGSRPLTDAELSALRSIC